MRGLPVGLAACALTSTASAESFPTKSIRILVGFPAGGPSDVPARLIADKLRVALASP